MNSLALMVLTMHDISLGACICLLQAASNPFRGLVGPTMLKLNFQREALGTMPGNLVVVRLALVWTARSGTTSNIMCKTLLMSLR